MDPDPPPPPPESNIRGPKRSRGRSVRIIKKTRSGVVGFVHAVDAIESESARQWWNSDAIVSSNVNIHRHTYRCVARKCLSWLRRCVARQRLSWLRRRRRRPLLAIALGLLDLVVSDRAKRVALPTRALFTAAILKWMFLSVKIRLLFHKNS